MGHIEIADHVTITATTFVTKSIRTAGTYTAVLPAEPAREWARTIAHLRSLERLSQRVRDLEMGSKPKKGKSGTRKR
jgi:UDP-3-O-[3-hydroxymyristoyl] glucosamine N-acyltransferase